MMMHKTLGDRYAQRDHRPGRLPPGPLAEGRVSSRDIWPCANGPGSG